MILCTSTWPEVIIEKWVWKCSVHLYLFVEDRDHIKEVELGFKFIPKLQPSISLNEKQAFALAKCLLSNCLTALWSSYGLNSILLVKYINLTAYLNARICWHTKSSNEEQKKVWKENQGPNPAKHGEWCQSGSYWDERSFSCS